MIEHILRFSIAHRVLVGLVTLLVAAYGLYSLTRLPIDAVPDITNNQVAINIESPALSPYDIEQQVAYPVETALAGIPGLSATRSISRNGFAQITAIFEDDIDIYFARAQVGERLAAVRDSLPPSTQAHMGAISTGLGEVSMWSVEFAEPEKDYETPEGITLATPFEKAMYLRTVQDWIIRPQLKSVSGVAEIDAIGGYAQQYHVQPDMQKLASLGLSLDDLIEALESGNQSTGAGYLESRGEAYIVRADGRLKDMAQIGQIVVSTRKGVPVYLKDIASVGYGRELRSGSGSKNGQEVVIGTAMMLKGGNSRLVAQAVSERLAEINKSLPAGIKAVPVLDRTKLVDATIATVEKNLAEGALLVIAVLFLLLGNLRAALITALVIPVTMLATATGMVRAGVSANLMSLGALDFGLIVDGAVIVTENCLRRLALRQHAEGRLLSLQERLDEVLQASRQMIQPAVFGQAIIITVYIPLLTFTGVEGKMFAPMAMTVIIALACAFILSLTFVPAMIALFVRGRVEEKESKAITKAKSAYAPLLARAIDRPRPVLLGAAAFFVCALLLMTRMGQEFIPTLDEKDIAMHAMRIPSTSISMSTAMQLQVEKEISDLPEVAYVFSKTGTAEMAADPMPPNVSDTFVVLKAQKDWPDSGMTKSGFIGKLEEAVSTLPGNNYEFTQPIQMRFNELIAGVRSDVAVKVYGDEFDAMLASASDIAAILRKIDGASDVKVEQVTGLPYLSIDIRRDQLARHGISARTILDTIAAAVGGREAGTIYNGDRRHPIVVRLPDNIRNDMAALENIPVPLPDGAGFLPLKEFAAFTTTEGPNQVSRENGKRRVVVQANVRGRDIGSFVNEAQDLIAQAALLPAGYWLDWGGQFENLQTARQRLAIVVPGCFLIIFMMLFTALGSARQALLVFSGIPLAISGGIFSLYLRDMPLSISAAVGFIALSGIAVLNGLVLISYINQLIQRGQTVRDAILQGSLTRLRPILMTALVASLGFVPMALSTGTGAEVQKPLATVVIGGLITATTLTLFVLPALLVQSTPRALK